MTGSLPAVAEADYSAYIERLLPLVLPLIEAAERSERNARILSRLEERIQSALDDKLQEYRWMGLRRVQYWIADLRTAQAREDEP
jgi:hypothetical protein